MTHKHIWSKLRNFTFFTKGGASVKILVPWKFIFLFLFDLGEDAYVHLCILSQLSLMNKEAVLTMLKIPFFFANMGKNVAVIWRTIHTEPQ